MGPFKLTLYYAILEWPINMKKPPSYPLGDIQKLRNAWGGRAVQGFYYNDLFYKNKTL